MAHDQREPAESFYRYQIWCHCEDSVTRPKILCNEYLQLRPPGTPVLSETETYRLQNDSLNSNDGYIDRLSASKQTVIR